MTEAPAVRSAKADPETLAIRTRPPRAIRFKRGMIVATAAIGSVSLLAVTWISLSPRLIHRAEQTGELSQPDARPGDALNSAPRTYGDVPRLGPPLPGDLGKPILEHQQAMGSLTPVDQQMRLAVAAERERQLAELRTARESGLLIQGKQVSGGGEGARAPESVPATPETDSATSVPDAADDPNRQHRKAQFIAALDPRGDVNPHSLVPLPSPYTLSAGSLISASLTTGVRSDLPGLVTAQVTENVWDSATGRILLVPQGARLIGSYDSVVAFGQKRALIVWQRIMMPDGSSLRLDNVPATDASGYAGLADKVDFHTWQILKGIALSTLLGVGSELALSGQGDLVRAIRMSTQDNVTRAGDQLTQRNLAIQPTITIRPGTPVRLVVHKDLVFTPVRAGN